MINSIAARLPGHNLISHISTLSVHEYEQSNLASFQIMIRGLQSKLGIFDLPAFFRGKKLLDVGCGTGADMLRFRDLGAEVMGLDRQPMIRGKLCIKGDATAMPLRSGQFDIVFSQHFTDLLTAEEFLGYSAESCRVLKPGGLFVVFDCFDEKSAELAAQAEKDTGFERIFFKGIESPLLIFKKPDQK